jgi:hypothetical protein
VILGVAACVLLNATGVFAQGQRIFKGEITQCPCARPGAHGTAADNAALARCMFDCANVGPGFVLSDPVNKTVYQLDDQKRLGLFGTQDVIVLGTLDKATRTIHVNNIVRDVPPRITRAKTVSIICDACPRGMAKVRKTAFEQLAVWKRFAVVPDPKKADLIFLFSANRYLGDYVTRDGPDTRPVNVDTTYMNVIDPHTGESLWGDSQRVGSWFVGEAAKDLIGELREQLEVDVNPAERQLFLKRNWLSKPPTDTGK